MSAPAIDAVAQTPPSDSLLESLLANVAPAVDAINPDAPVFLWGPPGSGVERLAAILREQAERGFLADRFGAVARGDGFDDGALLPQATDDFQQASIALVEQWYAQAEVAGATDSRVIDWLRHWDARIGLALRQALPGARLIVALRDPRDLLLNWLAFGSPGQMAFASSTSAAVFLQQALEQLAFTIEHDVIPVHRIDPVALQADPLQTTEDIARFIGLSVTPSPEPAQLRELASGNHPTWLADGHWRAYREVLAGPFAVLAPIAQRLGFAVD
ncbi:MAG: hypothetical protein ABI748_14005 [Dokdonella sp.]